MRKRTARMLWLLAGAVVLGLLAIGATSYVMRLDQEAGGAAVPIGGPFELVDQDGGIVTQQDSAGRLMLVTFGYAAPEQMVEAIRGAPAYCTASM